MALVLLSCGGKGPQTPSRWLGRTKVDSTELALMEMNFRLASAADAQIMAFAQAQEINYALYQAQAWVHIFTLGDESSPAPQRNEKWQVAMVVSDMKGRQLVDTEQLYIIGKHELPSCIEQNISEFHHGTKARIISPWYSAFGAQGTTDVPPYENVIIDLEIR